MERYLISLLLCDKLVDRIWSIYSKKLFGSLRFHISSFHCCLLSTKRKVISVSFMVFLYIFSVILNVYLCEIYRTNYLLTKFNLTYIFGMFEMIFMVSVQYSSNKQTRTIIFIFCRVLIITVNKSSCIQWKK